MTTFENEVPDWFLVVWRISLTGGPVSLIVRTALPLGALLSGHPLYEHTTWCPRSHLVLGHLKKGLAALLGDRKPWTWLCDPAVVFSRLTGVKAAAFMGEQRRFLERSLHVGFSGLYSSKDLSAVELPWSTDIWSSASSGWACETRVVHRGKRTVFRCWLVWWHLREGTAM